MKHVRNPESTFVHMLAFAAVCCGRSLPLFTMTLPALRAAVAMHSRGRLPPIHGHSTKPFTDAVRLRSRIIGPPSTNPFAVGTSKATERYKSTFPPPASRHTTSTVPDLDTLISGTLRDPNTSAVPDVGPRPQTKAERVTNFPKGVIALIKDCLQYKSIHDASKTPLNAWTINSPLLRHNKLSDGCRGFFIYEDEIRPGRIPRRQYEQQRQLQQDFRTMLPLILLWVPPIIGFVPPILAMFAPRQTMSRQFHNPYEIFWFNQIEYDQRRASFTKLGELFWSSFPLINVRKTVLYLEDECRQDEAGPIMDGMVLYSAFCDDPPRPDRGTGPAPRLELPPGLYTSVQDLPREYLVTLCLCIGVCQHLPGWMSRWMVELTPSFLLARQVERISGIVCHDDALLLEEGHDLNGCESLTDQEVTDACLVRALPVSRDHSAEVRRECLTNHLRIIAKVKRNMAGPVTDGFRLFTMHLAPLRYHLKMLHDAKEG